MNQMTFKEEDGYIVCYINGKEVSRAKKASAGASTQDVIDIINDQIKANPDLSGTEPDLTGVEFSGDKYAVPQGGGSSLMSDIVDVNGNYRFVEGNLSDGSTGASLSYKKWSLSGTHLMIVLAGTVSSNLTDYQALATVAFPSYINSKIFPLGTNAQLVSVAKGFFIKNTEYTATEYNFYLRKQSDQFYILPAQTITISETYNFRIQFDLLIDSE